MSEPRKVQVYEELHCPFCGSTEIIPSKENFNYKAGFWGVIFLHVFGLLIFGFGCRKRIECDCQYCGSRFSFYKNEVV